MLTPHDQGRSASRISGAKKWDSCEAQIRLRAERKGRDEEWVQKRLGGIAPLKAGGDLFEDLKWLVLSSQKAESGDRIDPVEKIRYPFVADMVGNTICADLLDYLKRDHVFSGLPVSLGQRYLSSFYITPEGSGGIDPETNGASDSPQRARSP